MERRNALLALGLAVRTLLGLSYKSQTCLSLHTRAFVGVRRVVETTKFRFEETPVTTTALTVAFVHSNN